MGSTEYGARRRHLRRSLLVATALLATSSQCLAQSHAGEQTRPGAYGLDAAFAEIGRSWIEANIGDRRRQIEEIIGDLEAEATDAAITTEAEALQGLVRAEDRSRRSLREMVRYETRLVGTEIMPGAQLSGATDLRSAASLAQQRARQAVIDYLADTSLGKSVGRFVFFNQDTAADANRSRLIPLVKPKLRYRSREVGISLVWRF